MNTAKMYEETLLNTKKLHEELQNEYNYNIMIYKILKTDDATPDIPLINFLNESIPDWTKYLDSQTVVDIVIYSTKPSEEDKNKLLQNLLARNQKIIHQTRDINLTLSDCSFEIDDKIAECNIKIEELLNQIKILSNRIGKIEAVKNKWLEIKQSL